MQKIVTLLIDDIDGSEAEGTVSFALDGVHYEIDLNKQHGEELRSDLKKYITHARKVRRGPQRPKRNTARIRKWAKAQGYKLSERGRIPADIEAKYDAAHNPQPDAKVR